MYGSVRGACDETHVPTATFGNDCFLPGSAVIAGRQARQLLGAKRTIDRVRRDGENDPKRLFWWQAGSALSFLWTHAPAMTIVNCIPPT
jgi:hypothetical protein